jgi:hypothetical protein
MTTSIDYAAQVDIQHYIVPMLMSAIELEDASAAAADNGEDLDAWMDIDTVYSGIETVTVVESPFAITIAGTAYPLDGTGTPIQLLNVTGAPLSGQTNDETVITHDAQTRGSTITVGVGNTYTAAYKGMTVHKSVDHKILEILNTYSVSENLGFKWLRIGPAGTNEKKLCYGRLSSLSEEGDAGALSKYGFNMNAQGRVYTIFDNPAPPAP